MKRFSKDSQKSEAGNWLRTDAHVDKKDNALEEDDLKLKHAKVMGDLEGLKQMYVKNDELTALQDKTESLAKENVKLEDKVKEKTNNEKLKMHNRVYHSHIKGTQSQENGVFVQF